MAPRQRHSERNGMMLRAAPWLLATATTLSAALPAAAQPAPTPSDQPAPVSTNPRAKGLAVKGPATESTSPPAAPPPAGSSAAAPPAPPPAPVRLSEAPPERLSQLCRNAALKLLQQRRRKAPPTAAEALDLADFKAMHFECFNVARASLTSGAADIGQEILRSVAQVVLNRAQRAAWVLLQEKLLDAAGCADPPKVARFPATCKILESISIADLASSPAALMQALVADVLAMSGPPGDKPWLKVPILEEVLRESATRWGQAGAPGIQGGLAQILRRRIKEQVTKPDCDQATTALEKSLWVSGMCLIEMQAPASFKECDVDGWASQCTDPITEARILQLWTIAGMLFAAQGKPQLSDYINFFATAADIEIEETKNLTDEQRREAHDYVAAVRSILSGISDKDWIGTTSGAVRALRLVSKGAGACASAPSGAECEESKRAERLFFLLAAVGNYAGTFSNGSKEAGETREKILENLANRLVDRTHRDGGWVVSAGGNLGLFGGARTDFVTAAAVAFPAQLGVGVGAQSYSTGNHGFHAMATIFDLGQYVTFSGAPLKVDPPDLKSAVTVGLTAGAWLGLRETPYYLGLYGGVSPFVTANGKPTYQVGLSTGLYVPLLDFN